MSSTPRSLLTLKRAVQRDHDNPTEERLHKVLANAGLGSRRMLEQRIADGEIRVNGEAAATGVSVRAGDRVEVDGKQFVVATDNPEHAQVLAYHKPEGELTTRDDPEGRPTVFENLPHLNGARWISVGRLDTNTTGLLLLTTDGNLANALMHPSHELPREYLCRVHGDVPDAVLEKLKAGVELEDGPARCDDIQVVSRGGSHSWFKVVLHEGRNREVRRLWDSQGFPVSRLKRIRYGNVELPRRLRPGQTEPLSDAAVTSLREAAGTADASTPSLTLRPVLHQRSATRGTTEIHASSHTPHAWTGVRHDEARELTRFDRVRPDDLPGRDKRRRGPPRGDVNGNVLKPDKPARKRKKRRGVAPGQELPSVRTWFAGEKRGGGQTRDGHHGRGPRRGGSGGGGGRSHDR